MRRTASALAMIAAVAFGAPVFGQSLESQPILLDVDSGSNGGDAPLLIAAFEPSDTSPVFASDLDGVQFAALQLEGDLPQPSIIIGRIAPGEEANFGIEALLPATIEEFGFAYNDLAAREALRESNPELFRKLVEGGHVDPPEDLLAVVMQTEMQRMNCYRSSIDGQWGPGSRRSVTSYYNTLDNGDSWTERNPAPELFRSVVLNGDVRCVVATAAPAAAAQPQRQTAPAAAPAPAPQTTQPRQRTFSTDSITGPRGNR